MRVKMGDRDSGAHVAHRQGHISYYL